MTLHILELIQKSLHEVVKRSDIINTLDDFLLSESGMILLDSYRMSRIHIA